METATSRDGTEIAYDRTGSGPPVILVGGALSYRGFKKMRQLTELLSDRLTVINYDRRGRGDSGNTEPFSIDREIEDIAALVDVAGGRASLWGWSSGGALALRAAAKLEGVERVAVYEVPFMVEPGNDRPTPDYGQRLGELVAAGDRTGAVKHFMRNAIGIPAPFVALMRLLPMWKPMEGVAHTLPYDWAALGAHNMRGEPLRPEEWTSVTVPVLVAHGAKSPGPLKTGSRALADVLPDAELRELEGQSHNPSMKALAPVVAEFVVRGGREQADVVAERM
jgi:pimeloyl-ACP methyl ester carboxylesterase